MLPPDDIDALVVRAQAGDRAAFRQLVLDLQNDLRFYVGAFNVTAGLAEEVVQATFVTAYHKLAQYQPQGAFRAWLKTIARNTLLKNLREQKRFADTTADTLEGLLVASGLEDVERMDELEVQTRKLRGCMDRLPASMRTLVTARYMEELSTAALAQRFKRTEIWVRVTLCRVRANLRRCIQGESQPS